MNAIQLTELGGDEKCCPESDAAVVITRVKDGRAAQYNACAKDAIMHVRMFLSDAERKRGALATGESN